ncbi:hypothetical protein [Alcaligenes faecalis]|uniref:hypothetical protein n=1 Tax=Alcaligenes faecalis TaxID=511 RepID=UPI000F67C0CD|nr:hypothetical protein [Alcaligenes faecalis]
MIIQDASATSDWTKEMLDELHVNLQPLEDCDFECDGMTYAIATALERAGITHRRMVGHVYWNPGQDVIDPHCWIELANGVVIDFRLRMWVGDDDAVPHGVFRVQPNDLLYVGQEQSTELPSWEVLEIMTDERLSQLRLYMPEVIR